MKFIYEICKEIYLLGSRGCAFCVLPWQLCLCTLVKIKLWQAPSERDGSCSKWLPVELKEHKGECSFFCSPFTRGEVHRVSVHLAPRSYQQLLVGKRIVFASQVSSLGIPHKSLKLFRALKQLLTSQGHLTRTTCSDFNSWWKKSLLLALQTLGGGVCPL